MFETLRRLRNRLSERPDSEHVQAYLRILSGIAGIIYALLSDVYATQIGGWSTSTQIWIFLAGIAIGGICFLIWIVLSPSSNPLRRWFGILHDTTWNGFNLYAFGDAGVILFAMYIWLVIGNGFRYGVRYLYGVAALSLISFYTVAYFSPFYRTNYGLLGLATFLLAVVIPIYLGGLLKRLQRNLEAAREADRLKIRFLSNVSHDLRTPLNVILASGELLARELRGQSHQFRQVQDMQEAARTLNGLVSDLLDVARMEAGRLALRPVWFNVFALFGRVVRLNRAALRAGGNKIYLRLDPNTPARAKGDTLRLEQVLNNIVSNALKYTERGEVFIDVRPSIDTRTNACAGIVCSVTDTGIGMDADVLGRIFSRFEQAEASYARRYPGAGLGLCIAKELVEIMGGTIEVDSEEGAGSCFTIRLPLPTEQRVEAGRDIRLDTLVVCDKIDAHAQWRQLLSGRLHHEVKVMSSAELVPFVTARADQERDPLAVLVDATGLDSDLSALPALVEESGSHSQLVWVAANVGGRGADLKAYRSAIDDATPEQIEHALAIAYWTTVVDLPQSDEYENWEQWLSALDGATVLIADDNALNRRVLVNMLEYAAVKVVEAGDGVEALNRLKRGGIDIAILDNQMPEMTGVQVMRTYAEQAPEKPVPMIALTADTTDECRADCLDAGAQAVLHKPVLMNSLYRTLHRVATGHRAEELPDRSRRMSAADSGRILDYDLLRELAASGRRPDYVNTLVECFGRDGGRLIAELERLYKAHDQDACRALLHRLKGMSATIGAVAMESLCGEMLAAFDTGRQLTLEELKQMLHRMHRDTMALLEAFTASSEASTDIDGCYVPFLR